MIIDRQQIQQIPLFADLPDSVLEALTHIAIPVQRRAGDILFYKGDPAPGLYAILHGRVKIAREAPSGREQVLTIAGVGQHFNTVPIFDQGPCPANAQAVTDADLVLFPVDALREVVEKQPTLAMALLAECCGYLRQLVSLVDDLALAT
ncbi:MAG: cyclic nucleotide-binding domain-containing protein, partial [Blastochloris sp.]|nr:cyclic nucleotide-binding domain-containing protein [Blastochloris sp.]